MFCELKIIFLRFKKKLMQSYRQIEPAKQNKTKQTYEEIIRISYHICELWSDHKNILNFLDMD